MTTFVALLRAINVGGTGLLPMKELITICSKLGFQSVRTYIQSGNVVFESDAKEAAVRTSLEEALAARMGKKIDVMVRTSEEMRLVLRRNPFPDKEPDKVAVLFMTEPLPKDLLKNLITPDGEIVEQGRREAYVYYPNGAGRSKLKLPLKGTPVTIRNVNTVAKLVEMSGG